MPDLSPLVRHRPVFGQIEIDVVGQTARFGAATHRLDGRSLRLLCLLAANAGRVLTRAEIADELDCRPGTPTSNPVDHLVVELRRRLGEDPRHPALVETVPGEGYRVAAWIGGAAAAADPA